MKAATQQAQGRADHAAPAPKANHPPLTLHVGRSARHEAGRRTMTPAQLEARGPQPSASGRWPPRSGPSRDKPATKASHARRAAKAQSQASHAGAADQPRRGSRHRPATGPTRSPTEPPLPALPARARAVAPASVDGQPPATKAGTISVGPREKVPATGSAAHTWRHTGARAPRHGTRGRQHYRPAGQPNQGEIRRNREGVAAGGVEEEQRR